LAIISLKSNGRLVAERFLTIKSALPGVTIAHGFLLRPLKLRLLKADR